MNLKWLYEKNSSSVKCVKLLLQCEHVDLEVDAVPTPINIRSSTVLW